jgi:hypothetical protein
LDPRADKLDEETIPRTRERGERYDETGTLQLLAHAAPLDLVVEGELWVVFVD